jgi:hypothetical protein
VNMWLSGTAYPIPRSSSNRGSRKWGDPFYGFRLPVIFHAL